MTETAIRRYVAEATPALFHADDSFVRGIMGPFGSGKSVAMCMEIIARAARQAPHEGRRKSRWAVCRNTYPMLRSTTIRTWQEWIDPNLAPVVYGSPITCHLVCRLPDSTTMDLEVLFLALDRPQDTRRLLSLELTGAWLNEAREFPREILKALTGRVGRYPPKRDGGPSWRGIIADTNPPNTRHWWYEAAEVTRPDGWRFWRQPPALLRDAGGKWVANPLAENVRNQPLGYAYWRQQLSGQDDEWIKVHILGEYGNVFAGRPVYEGAYSDDVHLASRPLGVYRGLPIWLGWDFGLDPACCAVQMAPNGQVRVLREWVSEDTGLNQFVTSTVKPALTNAFQGMRIISRCDPAGNQRAQTDETTCVQILGSLGIPTEVAPTNDYLPRREAVLKLLQRRIGDESGLLLDPSCRTLREGFLGGYQYARIQASGEERYRDQPEKSFYSHIAEALQYVCLSMDSSFSAETRTGKAQKEVVHVV